MRMLAARRSRTRRLRLSGPGPRAGNRHLPGRPRPLRRLPPGAGPAFSKVLWSFPTRGPVRGSPAVAGDTVLFGSGDGHLYALDAGSGRERWRASLGGAVASSPAVSDGTVFATSRERAVTALDLADGGRALAVRGGPGSPVCLGVGFLAVFAGRLERDGLRRERATAASTPWTPGRAAASGLRRRAGASDPLPRSRTAWSTPAAWTASCTPSTPRRGNGAGCSRPKALRWTRRSSGSTGPRSCPPPPSPPTSSSSARATPTSTPWTGGAAGSAGASPTRSIT